MSTPYRFTPRVPAPPHPTPASASAYILPPPKALRPPLRNPYDTFTQRQFDAFIDDITSALRRALGQDEEPLTTTRKQEANGESADGYPRYKPVMAEDSDDEPMDDSFADLKARRAGKGKARDPREGPGLGKGDSLQPIQIISSDEEEEGEVELSMVQLDEESEEEDEEYSDEEEYAWERGQSSSQPIPSPRKRKLVKEVEEYEEEEEVDEGDEGDFEEYDEEEYDEDEEEEEEEARGSSPQVIELISDDEEDVQPPAISKRPGKERQHTNEEEEVEEEVEVEEDQDEYGSDEYEEYTGEDQEGKESLSPTMHSSNFVPQAGREVINVDEDEILEDDEETEPIEPPEPDASLPPKWRRSLDLRQNRVEIPDPWEGPRTYAEDFYSGGDIRPSSGQQMDASHLGPEDDDIVEELPQPESRVEIPDPWEGPRTYAEDFYSGGDIHPSSGEHMDASHLGAEDNDIVEIKEVHEENAEDIQPLSNNTSFPPEITLSPAQQQREIEIPDAWSGPRHYAQDFYSGGPLTLPPDATPNPDHLGTGDTEYIDVVDPQEEFLEEEIEDEIQPFNADDSFPRHEMPEEDTPVIVDPWEGPQIFAEDFYSGGDVRTMPGVPIDPSLLSGTGDLDDGIDAFLTPGALSPPSQIDEIISTPGANEEDVNEEIHAPPQHYVTAQSRRGQPIPADAEFISIDDSDDEQEKEQDVKEVHPVSEEADYTGLYDFEALHQGSDLQQQMVETIEEDANIIVPPFGTTDHEQAVAVEHGDGHQSEKLNNAEQQSSDVEDDEADLTTTQDQNGIISNFVDESSIFISEMSPSTLGPFYNAEFGSTTLDHETRSQPQATDYILPAEVIEPEIVQEEVVVEAVEVSSEYIDLDAQVDSATILQATSLSATAEIVSSEDAEDTSHQDQVPVDDAQNVPVSADEKALSVEDITNVDAEIPSQPAETVPTLDDEVQNAKSDEEEILVDAVELETNNSFASVGQGTELKPNFDIQETAEVEEIPIMPTIPDNLSQNHTTATVQEQIPVDLDSLDSIIQPPQEGPIDEGVQEKPISFVPSGSPSAQQMFESEQSVKEEPHVEQPETSNSMDATEDNSTEYIVFEAIVDEFMEDDADEEADQEIEITSVVTALDMQERQEDEEDEYTIEEPITEGRRTEEPPERATSLGIYSVGPDEIAPATQREDLAEPSTHASLGEASEATRAQEDAATMEEEGVKAVGLKPFAEISAEVTMLREEALLDEVPKGDSTISETGRIEEPQATTNVAETEATETAPIAPELIALSDRHQSLASAPNDPKKQPTEEPALITAPLTPSSMRTISQHTTSPSTPKAQSETSIGNSLLTGELRTQVMSSINRAFFSPTLPNYFGDLNVGFHSLSLPPADRNDLTGSLVTIPTVIPTPVPATATPMTVPVTTTSLTAVPPTNRPIVRRPRRPTLPSGTSSSTLPPPLTMTVSLTRSRPVLMSDPYPYSLSTPYDPFAAYIIPEEGSEEDTGLDNSMSSISTLEQERDKKISAASHDDGEDLELEFQYPPEDEVIEELKNAGFPLPDLKPSKVENGTLAVVSASTAQSAETIISPSATNADDDAALGGQEAKPSSGEVAVPPSSNAGANNLNTATLPSTSSVELDKPQLAPAKAPKRSQKRKRDTSPGPGSAQVSHTTDSPVGQKGKGKRASKSERKVKTQESKELAPEPTSEETIRVVPRPKSALDHPPSQSEKPAEGGPPPFRLLQGADRASSIASSTPSDISAGIQQPSPTVNKPYRPSQTSQASLFHAHGKGRKQMLPSFPPPPKLVKHKPQSEQTPTSAPSSSRRSEQPALISASVPDAPKADSVVSDAVVPPTSESTATATPPTTSTSTAQLVTTPATTLAESSPVPTLLATTPATITPATNQSTPSTRLVIVLPAPSSNTPTPQASHRARPSRVPSMTSSPVTRSHCKYHRISLPKEEGGPRVCFLVPGCSLNDKELIEEEEIEDHGDATVEDSYRMIKDIDSLGFHADLIGLLRQLVGLDILREQEVFYLPAPGEEVSLRKNSLKKSASEKSAMVRVPAEPSSHAGSPVYSGAFAASPSSWQTGTPFAGSNSPSITGRRSIVDSEKGSSFAHTDTEQEFSEGEEPQMKRVRPSPPEEHKSMGPPLPVQSKGSNRHKRVKKPKIPQQEEEAIDGGDAEADKAAKKPRKSTSKRGLKRSRTSEVVNAGEGDEQSSRKKLKLHLTAPGKLLLSTEKPAPSTSS